MPSQNFQHGRAEAANSSRTSLFFALVSALCVLVYAVYSFAKFHNKLPFDDAFMFWRYALHLRQGLGVSWNLDGAHTYGLTSPLWGLVILVFTYLPFRMETAVALASAASSIVALAVLIYGIVHFAQSRLLRNSFAVLPLVMLPIVFTQTYRNNIFTGMETMLAIALCAWLLLCVLQTARGEASALWISLAGWLFFLCRPESALVTVLLVALAAWQLPDFSMRQGIKALGIFFLFVALWTGFAALYFHTPVPLAFYMKSHQGYPGYIHNWRPFTQAIQFFVQRGFWVLLLLLFARRSQRALLLITLVPLFAVTLYLLTVLQIMGNFGRYYLPYLPLLVLPGAIVLDAAFLSGFKISALRYRLAAVLVFALLVFPGLPHSLLQRVDAKLQHGLNSYPVPQVTKNAATPLKELGFIRVFPEFSNNMLQGLPQGITLAATEVGLPGAVAPQVNIIDMAGLNDSDIALHGFEPARFLARNPDLIWMPHPDYTWQVGVLETDPVFLKHYDLYDGAFDYGIAIRKDGPYTALLTQRLAASWPRLYPNSQPQDYLAHSITWAVPQHLLAPTTARINDN